MFFTLLSNSLKVILSQDLFRYMKMQFSLAGLRWSPVWTCGRSTVKPRGLNTTGHSHWIVLTVTNSTHRYHCDIQGSFAYVLDLILSQWCVTIGPGWSHPMTWYCGPADSFDSICLGCWDLCLWDFCYRATKYKGVEWNFGLWCWQHWRITLEIFTSINLFLEIIAPLIWIIHPKYCR